MTRSRSHQLLCALALVAAILCEAIAGAASTTAQGPTAIRFAFWGDPAERAAYEQVIEGFEATHPGIDVAIDYTPGQSDFYRKIATDFAGNDPPDVFLINYRQFGQYAAPRRAGDGRARISTRVPRSRPATTRRSRWMHSNTEAAIRSACRRTSPAWWSITTWTCSTPTACRLPAAGWTWEEFVAAAQALTQDTDGDGADRPVWRGRRAGHVPHGVVCLERRRGSRRRSRQPDDA